MTTSFVKRLFLLAALLASFSLTGCGLFCDDEDGYDYREFEGEAQALVSEEQ